MDPDMFFEKKEGIHTLAQAELQQDVDQLLSATADHYQVTEGIVEALAETKPDIALKITRLLNVEFRRDASLLDLLKEMVGASENKNNLSFIQKAIDELADPDLKDEVVFNVVAHLSDLNENPNTFILDALPIIDRIKDIRNPSQRCLALCYAYAFLMKQTTDQYSSLSSNLLHQLEKAWSNIDVEWHKINMGFKITKHLATSSVDEARRYLQLTEKLRDEVMLDAKTVALAYMYCIRLAIRVYSGLLPRSIGNFDEDLQQLARLINNIVSYGERARLWTELALSCYINKRFDAGNDIVRDYIRRLLQNISEEDKVYRNEVLITAAPALYYDHKKITIEQIQQLSQDERNQACEQICKFILHKQLPSDPYDALPVQGYDINLGEIVDICEVLDLTDCDQDIYNTISCVSDTMTSQRFKDRFTAGQKADIALRFEKIVDNKLPSARFIRHAGYKIAAKAQIARFGRGSSQVWNDLVEEARQIPNIADQAFVLAMIAEAMPSKVAEKRKLLFVEAQELIKKIPAIFDKIEHYESLASIAIKIEPTMYKDLLKLAMVAASGTQSSERYAVQRRLVDIAHKVDSDFAASLASIADDDPARKKLKERLQVLNLKKEVANQFTTDEHLSKEVSSQDYAEVAWMLLGALNAGSIAAKNMSQLRNFIQVASSLPFSKSYRLFAWIVENITRSYAKTEQVGTFIRPIYNSLLLDIELIRRMAGRSLKQLKQTQRQLAESVDQDNLVVHPGERDKAIQFIRDWFINNVHEYLKISDEYFGPDELEILLLLRSVKPNCKVQILTSKQHQDNEKVGMPNKWEEVYCTYWRLHVSSVQDPPDTEITVIGTITRGESPVHDRWWLTEGSGIRVGTSFNGLGNSLSEISILSPEVAATREREVDNYLQWLVREYKGEKLQRWVFPLH
jgi:hypothetical protein